VEKTLQRGGVFGPRLKEREVYWLKLIMLAAMTNHSHISLISQASSPKWISSGGRGLCSAG